MLIFKVISKLPFCLLYFLSDILSFSLFHIARYRRSISYKNIKNSFPDKNDTEIKVIQRSAYRHLTDSFLEIIKASTLTDHDLQSRVTLHGFSEIQQNINNGQPVLFLSAHTAPLEWVLFSTHLKCNCKIDPVYKPVHSKKLDRFIFDMRSRYKSTPIPYKNLAKDIALRKNVPRCIAIMSDLEPRSRDQYIELDFLNQPTRFFLSSERIAKLTNFPVFFIAAKQTKRGYYLATAHKLSDNPKDLESNMLTREYAKCIEQLILNNPAYWLWTHKRWKHNATS